LSFHFNGGITRPDLFSAKFLVIFASLFSFENQLFRPTEHLLVLVAGAVAGLANRVFHNIAKRYGHRRSFEVAIKEDAYNLYLLSPQ